MDIMFDKKARTFVFSCMVGVAVLFVISLTMRMSHLNLARWLWVATIGGQLTAVLKETRHWRVSFIGLVGVGVSYGVLLGSTPSTIPVLSLTGATALLVVFMACLVAAEPIDQALWMYVVGVMGGPVCLGLTTYVFGGELHQSQWSPLGLLLASALIGLYTAWHWNRSLSRLWKGGDEDTAVDEAYSYMLSLYRLLNTAVRSAIASYRQLRSH